MLMITFSAAVVADGIYLWEYNRNGEHACCLSLSGTDICNPHTPCTRNVLTDIMGINDYITRLLGLEKAGSLSYATILNQAQYYIKHVLYSSITQLTYRFDEYRNVKFFHEMNDAPKQSEKQAKAAPGPVGPATSGGAAALTVGAKKDDPVFAYLVKMGLARPWDRK